MWIGCARILRAQLDPVRIWVWTSVSSRRRTSHFSFQTEHIESASANTDEIIKYIITQKKTKTFNTEEVIVEKTEDRIFRRILETWDVSVQTDHVVVISSWITPHAGNLRERGIKSQCVQLSVLLYLLREESCFVSGDSSIVLRGSRQLRHRFKTRPQARRPAVMEKQHITHNLLLWIMKCPLFAQVNWCKPFQDLHLKSQWCKHAVSLWAAVLVFLLPSPLPVTGRPFDTMFLCNQPRHRSVTIEEARGTTACQPRATECCSCMLGGAGEGRTDSEGAVSRYQRDSCQNQVRGRHGWMNEALMRRIEGIEIMEEVETTHRKAERVRRNVTPNNQIKTDTWEERERRSVWGMLQSVRTPDSHTASLSLRPGRQHSAFWFIP